ITILTGHEVTKILQDDGGAVVGVTAKNAMGERIFYANRGVIFGSGGYSHNPELMLRFQRGPHYGGCAVPTNTGDFIKLAGEIGAAIGNTAGAFRAQSMLEVYLKSPSGSSNVFYIPGDSVIEVNKYGKRVMDEKRNYTDRTMAHFVWDSVKAEWTNMLLFMIWDERTANLWQGYPPYPVKGEEPYYIIYGQTLGDLSIAIEKRLASLAEHTGGFSLAPEFLQNLQKSIASFNAYAQSGEDVEFGRGDTDYDREWTTFPPTLPGAQWPPAGKKNYTMYPFSDKGPYYAVILAAGTLDTSGGPLTDEHARVLDWRGRPIPGLYGAGNCIASPTANAYWGGAAAQ
ncbi:FAD-binding protein, partial [Eubacteriales bacterium OttesenSCG-928-K08]|nr:FAD-binding protein [Eubacteriales bacterium OttesenSCG-928-K08]